MFGWISATTLMSENVVEDSPHYFTTSTMPAKKASYCSSCPPPNFDNIIELHYFKNANYIEAGELVVLLDPRPISDYFHPLSIINVRVNNLGHVTCNFSYFPNPNAQQSPFCLIKPIN